MKNRLKEEVVEKHHCLLPDILGADNMELSQE